MDLPALIVDAKEQLAGWNSRRVDAGNHRVPSELSEVRRVLATFLNDVRDLRNVLSRDDLEEIGHQDLAELLQLLVDSLGVAANLPCVRELEATFDKRGIERVTNCVGQEVPPELAEPAVEHAWLSKVLEDLDFQDNTLRTFDAARHSRQREEYADTDREHLASTPIRVKRLAAESIVEPMERHTGDRDLVRKEANKRQRHLSVRQLFARAPHIVRPTCCPLCGRVGRCLRSSSPR